MRRGRSTGGVQRTKSKGYKSRITNSIDETMEQVKWNAQVAFQNLTDILRLMRTENLSRHPLLHIAVLQ